MSAYIVDDETIDRALHYQCSEGNVPEHELYKRLEKAVNHLRYEIISNLPEYREAQWA